MGINKYSQHKWFVHKTIALVLCFLFLFPSTLLAIKLTFPPVAFIAATNLDEEDDGLYRDGLSGNASLGAGGVVVDNESFKFGEHTGLNDTTGFAYGDTDLNYNHGPYYIDIFADDLGLEKRRIYVEGGSYGDFSVYAGFDQTPYLISNFNNSFFDGIGTNALTLPTGFTTGGSTSGMTITGVDPVNLEVDDRFSFTAGGSKTFGDLKFNLDFKREDKQSINSLGSVFGTAWFDAGSTVAPVAFDQVTHEGTASLQYDGKYGQVQLQYFFSDFNNQRESYSIENPFTIGAANGLISGDPDNQHHQVSLSGGISLNHNTRISAIAEYGIMNQDESLLPYAVGTSTGLLPRQTADAYIVNTHVGLNMSTQPLPRLSLSAQYKFYQTVNQTPQDLFLKFSNDELATQATNTSDDALFNLPYDYIQNKVNIKGVYKIARDTSFKFDYEFDDMERDFRAVSETREHTVKARLKSTHFDHMHFNANASYAYRLADDYVSNNVFIARHLDTVVGLNSVQFEVNPDLRRYDIADRERVKYGASLTFLPDYFINVGINAQFQDDDYNNSILGLIESQNRNITVDVNYSGNFESMYLFYTYDETDDRQKGREFSSTATSSMTSNDWEALHDDKTHTLGFGGYIGFWNDELVLKADYIIAYSITDINFLANSGVSGVSELPLLESYRHTLKAKAVWQFDDHTDFGIRYIGELFETDDWSKDGFTPSSTSLDQVLLLTNSQQDYLGHIGLIYATIHFGGRK
ncbi:MAG: MtrB/PioB family decaheme-associated outer membrane protein [Nitrospinales bacterium]